MFAVFGLKSIDRPISQTSLKNVLFLNRLKIDTMMENEKGDNSNAELTRAVYDVANLFWEVRTRGYVPFRKDVVNINVGDLIVFQLNGDVQLSRAVLAVAVVLSFVVSPVSKKVSVFCELYKFSAEHKCFEPTGKKLDRVPYEHLRVKFVGVRFDAKKRVFLDDFGAFPSLNFFS